MAYPLSSAVSAGQPTAVDHYNNLRLDSLFLGNAAADAAPLGGLLQRYQYNLNLAYLATNRVRVTASVLSPVCVVVNGYSLVATANVDLAAAPSGGAATWYIFAVRTAGSTTFTLTANTTSTETTDQRRIGSCYWDGTQVVRDSVCLEERSASLANLKYAQFAGCDGRLTLASGAPVPTTDQSGSTVYFTPYLGNTIALYVNAIGWIPYNFSEVSISLSGVASGTNSDIFAYDNSGTVALEKVAWTNDTTRATALTLQNGIYVKSGDASRRYLGTVRTSALSTAADSMTQRLVWNYHNRVQSLLYALETTGHTYTGAARKWNNSDVNNKLEFVIGVQEDNLIYSIDSSVYQATGLNIACVYGYLDGSSINSYAVSNTTTNPLAYGNTTYINPAPGYHTMQAYEYATGGTNGTFSYMHLMAVLNR